MEIHVVFHTTVVMLKELKELLTNVKAGCELISLEGCSPNEVGPLIDLSDLRSFRFIMCICLQIIF